jgi:hypothetical protein
MQSIATAFVSIACSDSIHEFMCHVVRNGVVYGTAGARAQVVSQRDFVAIGIRLSISVRVHTFDALPFVK